MAVNTMSIAPTVDSSDQGPTHGVDHLFYEDLAAFYREIDDTLAVLQAEFLSEATRKEQRILLALSFLLLLVARGTIQVKAEQTAEIFGLKLAISFGGTLVALGGVVCLFFLVTYAIRAYADWASFSIRRARSEALIEVISRKLEYSWNGRQPKPFEETEQALELGASAVFDDTEVDWEQYNKQRSEYNRNTWGLVKKRAWVQTQVSRVRRTRWLRFTFELLFPIIFGAVALIEAYKRIG